MAISLTVHTVVVGVAVSAAALAARDIIVPPRVHEVVLVDPAPEAPAKTTPRAAGARPSRPAPPRVATPRNPEPGPAAPSSPPPKTVPELQRPEPPIVAVQPPQTVIAPEPVAADAPHPTPLEPSSTVDLVTFAPAPLTGAADGRTVGPSAAGAGAPAQGPADAPVGGAHQGASAAVAAARADEGPAAMAFPRYNDNAKPAYPRRARLRGEQGTVLLSVHVTEDGRVGDVRIAQSSGFPELDEAGLAAVRHWTFHPARRGDRAIAASIRVPIRFRLEDGR